MLERYKLSRGRVLILLLDQGRSCSAWPSARPATELLQREPTIWSGHADCKAAGCLERLRSPSQPGLRTPAFSMHSRKHGVAMSPALAPPAAWSAAGHPTPLLSWLMSYCFLRSQNSHGKFPEHKVNLRS